MASNKIAITLPESLLKETDELISNTKETRSGLIQKALKEYISRQREERTLQQLNEIYGEASDTEDEEFLVAAKDYFGDNVIDRESW